jgi:hypothetical protein
MTTIATKKTPHILKFFSPIKIMLKNEIEYTKTVDNQKDMNMFSSKKNIKTTIFGSWFYYFFELQIC